MWVYTYVPVATGLVDIVYVTVTSCHSFSVTNTHTHAQKQYNCHSNHLQNYTNYEHTTGCRYTGTSRT